ncbi:MAG TPA: efflux RND transporter permease subunit [Candidatus Ozemobacteraceae bacterium]|nr:efflux RND transporter permease subunit [Candidatus Ozemobacteraceae bacterium]
MSSHLSATPQEETSLQTVLPRFFVRSRQVAWVLLISVLLWGVYGYFGMPQRKDPEIPVHLAVAITAWPGASAEKIEQLVTRRIETKVAENAWVETIESTSRTNVSIVFVTLDKRLAETGREFDDIALKLNAVPLPAGAGPINFIRDFGDTSALMLTVASPLVDEKEIEVRARFLQDEILSLRAGTSSTERVSAVLCLPHFPVRDFLARPVQLFAQFLQEKARATDIRTFEIAGMVGADFSSPLPDERLNELIKAFLEDNMRWPELSLEAWEPFLVRDPAATREAMAAVAGPKFSYRQLDTMTELIEKNLKTLPQVSKVNRVGLLQEAIYLVFKQERLAAHGLKLADLPALLEARNRLQPGGMLSIADRNIMIEGSGAFQTPEELGNVLLSVGNSGTPLYLRDLFEQFRGYQDPPRFLNYLSKPDARGTWKRFPAVTIAVQMRPGEKIGRFGAEIDRVLESLRQQLPAELILERTSDQPVQVSENIHLFLKSLIEAVILVVLISWIGFWDWRTALLLAASIPLTLAMTFGMMHLLRIDLQQVSIASLIIALGLLVDVPVVAGDSIKRLLGNGVPSSQACWLGPSRLNKALFFATLTNIVAYLPFLMLSGNVGRFLYSLPVVITCSLIAANIVSLTFVPLVSRSLLRPVPEPSIAELRKSPLYAAYGRLMETAVAHRKKVLLLALSLLVPGAIAFSSLPRQFFAKDLSYLSYVDVWLPDDAPLSATNEIAAKAEKVIRDTAEKWGAEHPGMSGATGRVLANLTTFVGGGGPRFWFSVSPELQQLNYAQILVEVTDKHVTRFLVPRLQEALSEQVPGARFDVRQLETGEPVGVPVSLRIFGQDLTELRERAAGLKKLLSACPFSERVRDNWGTPNLTLSLETLGDRANLSGITHLDVTSAAAIAVNGFPLTKYREGDREIPVIARSALEQRAHLSDLENLYVFSLLTNQRQPLGQVANLQYRLKPEKIQRRNQFRCVTVSCFPAEGYLPSQVIAWLRPGLASFAESLPLGYRLEIAGEQEKQDKGFRELAVVLGVSVCMIYLALVFQFSHALKPLIVFGAIPFGMLGAVLILLWQGAPFGFMAFLGVASLIGVIVSHIIVLFDFIEEERERGAGLEDALLDAGIMRLRPVMITVAATLIALLPLARHGGPLWEPLCYAQIGGLAVATLVTLLLVPTLYAVFVRDLGLVEWPEPGKENRQE